MKEVKHNKKSSPTSDEHPLDEFIGVFLLKVSRYFSSGLIAGGAAVMLTMLLSAINIHTQSLKVLDILFAFLFTGSFVFFSFGRYLISSIPFPRLFLLLTAFLISYQVYSAFHVPTQHPINAFTTLWWNLFSQAFIATIIGSTFRFWADFRIDMNQEEKDS